jgi:hypothetical protein
MPRSTARVLISARTTEQAWLRKEKCAMPCASNSRIAGLLLLFFQRTLAQNP